MRGDSGFLVIRAANTKWREHGRFLKNGKTSSPESGANEVPVFCGIMNQCRWGVQHPPALTSVTSDQVELMLHVIVGFGLSVSCATWGPTQLHSNAVQNINVCYLTSMFPDSWSSCTQQALPASLVLSSIWVFPDIRSIMQVYQVLHDATHSITNVPS